MLWNRLNKVALVLAVLAGLGDSGMMGMTGRPGSSAAHAVSLAPHPHWTREITTRPVEINDEAVIAWGKARNGIRVGLSPRSFIIAADQESIEVTIWFENTGKQDRNVLFWDEWFSFEGKRSERKFSVEYQISARVGWRGPPPFRLLKPGQRIQIVRRLRFDGPERSDNYVGLWRPIAAEPVILTAAWKYEGPASEALLSDSIQIALKK